MVGTRAENIWNGHLQEGAEGIPHKILLWGRCQGPGVPLPDLLAQAASLCPALPC